MGCDEKLKLFVIFEVYISILHWNDGSGCFNL